MEMLYGTPFLPRMPRVQPRKCFKITPQTLQAHPGYPWGVWESINESVSREYRVTLNVHSSRANMEGVLNNIINLFQRESGFLVATQWFRGHSSFEEER